MLSVYLGCAAIAGTILIVQLILTLIGMGTEGDFDVDAQSGDVHVEAGAGDFHIESGGDALHVEADHVDHDAGHHGSSWFFGMLSFRAIVAAVAFFGAGGVVGTTGGLHEYTTLMLALLCGAGAMVFVAWAMRMLGSLHDSGTVNIHNVLGTTGTVYLTIPAHNQGRGKVTVEVQNRTMEYPAVTDSDALPTGTEVEIVRIGGGNVLEVAPAGRGRGEQ